MQRRDFLKIAPLLSFPAKASATQWDMIEDDVIASSFSMVDSKPLMLAYTSDGCLHCRTAAKELTGELPFQLQWTSKAPPWVEAFPTFHWQGIDGKWKSVTGWPGRQSLLQSFTHTQSTRLQKPTATTPLDITRRSGDWTWPGNLSAHLCQSHGYCGSALPRTHREQIELHNRLHESRVAPLRRNSFLFLEW